MSFFFEFVKIHKFLMKMLKAQTIYIWIKGPQFTDRAYLNDTNNAAYEHPIKNPGLQNTKIS